MRLVDDHDAEVIAGRYLELVRQAYSLERGERRAELVGRRLPYRDAAGLNPISYVTGQYHELYDVMCLLLGFRPGDAQEQLLPSALELRAAARKDAVEEWLAEVRHGWVREVFEEHARAEEERTPGLRDAREKAAEEPPVF